MHLDSFWSRATGTIRGNRDKTRHYVDLSSHSVHDGPFLGFDHCGYEVAIAMLLYSTNAGKIH